MIMKDGVGLKYVQVNGHSFLADCLSVIKKSHPTLYFHTLRSFAKGIFFRISHKVSIFRIFSSKSK